METKTVPLTKGAFALVSAEDYEMISRYKWHLTTAGYAARTETGRTHPRSKHRVYMHRVIMGAPDGMQVDHKDHNPLNNTRENLRTVTSSENQQNRRKLRDGHSSEYKGVHFKASRSANGGKGCWAAYIISDGHKIHLGHYETQWDAGWRYNLEAQKLFGEFANLNQIPADFMASKPGPTVFSDRGHSKFRGVTWNKGMKKWLAYLSVAGERVYSSYHTDELAAARSYNENALRIHGDKAKLNVLPMAPEELGPGSKVPYGTN